MSVDLDNPRPECVEYARCLEVATKDRNTWMARARAALHAHELADKECRDLRSQVSTLTTDLAAARASLDKVRRDLDTMIAVHDEVEAERDRYRSMLRAADPTAEEVEALEYAIKVVTAHGNLFPDATDERITTHNANCQRAISALTRLTGKVGK